MRIFSSFIFPHTLPRPCGLFFPVSGYQRVRLLANAISRGNSFLCVFLAIEMVRLGRCERISDDIRTSERLVTIGGAHSGEVSGGSVRRGRCLPFLLVLVSRCLLDQGSLPVLCNEHEFRLFGVFIIN